MLPVLSRDSLTTRGPMARLSLADFYGEDGRGRVGGLLDAMRQQSRPVKPRDLGCIGEAHLRAKFERAGVAPQTFDYRDWAR